MDWEPWWWHTSCSSLSTQTVTSPAERKSHRKQSADTRQTGTQASAARVPELQKMKKSLQSIESAGGSFSVLLFLFVLRHTSFRISVKSEEFLCNLVSCNGKLSAALSRKVRSLSQKSPSQPEIQSQIQFAQILPQFLFLLHIFLCPGLDGQYGRNRHHNLEITHHIMAKLTLL